MDICFTCHRYAPLVGGYETQAGLLAESLSKFFKVQVLTFRLAKSPYRESCNGVEIHRVSPQLVFFRIPLSFNFLRVLKRLDFDVLHAHGAVPLISDASILYAKSRKKKTVYTHHFDGTVQDSKMLNRLADFYNRTLGRLSAKLSDAVVTTSKSYAETSAIIRPYLHKVTVIPCSVDTNVFRPEPESTVKGLRESLRLSGEKVVLFVGRIVPYKGLEFLIRAFERVEKEADGEFHLLMIGKGEGSRITGGSSYYDKIRGLVENSGIKSRVRFIPWVSKKDLPTYYSLADVVVLPSVMRGEAFGTALVEALACGTPVVASDLPGVRDVLKGKDHIGCYVPPKNSDLLAESLVKTAYEKTYVSESCRQFVVDNYSIEHIVEKYVKLYQRLE